MTSVKNLSSLGSMAVHTLREGSTTERIVLGAALLATGAYVAYKICQVVTNFFKTAQPGEALPIYRGLTLAERKALEDEYAAKYFCAPVVASPKKNPELNKPVPQPPAHSLLESLTLNGAAVMKELEVPLAIALHGYQELKQELKKDIDMGGDEDLFIFLADNFLRNETDRLLPEVTWEEKKLKLKMDPHYNDTFAELESNLQKVGLSLKNLTRSEKPFAVAKFKDGLTKEIHSLADLYQTIKLQGPHILSSLEVDLKKKEIEKEKIQLHESRMEIIDKTLLTLKAVLINDAFVESFGKKNKTLYSIVGSNPDTLHFVLENICWHALDRVFETVETTFTFSKEAEQKTRKLDLETRLGKVLKDETKLKEAQSYLVQILKKPDDKAMGTLVKLLLDEEGNTSEREALVKKLQTPELQSQEESIEKELGRLRGLQQYYHTVKVAVAVAEEGKNALLRGNGDKDNKAKSTVRQISSPPPRRDSDEDNNRVTYAKQIVELSGEIVKAGSAAVEEVARLKWDDSLRSLDEELTKVPHLSSDLCAFIVKNGWVDKKCWVDFDQNRSNALLPLTGEHRWLITKKMIVQKLAKQTLQQKGKELLQEAGNKGAYFFNTMYGRFVTAFLAFDQRTREAGEASEDKPADCIAETFVESVLKCHQALGRVHKVRPKDVGNREDGVVKKLKENGGIHLNAVNTPGADAVFLGHLILQLLSVLQPEGLARDLRDALNKSWINPGEAEPTLIQDMIRKYKESIRPAVEPWVKPGGDFLMHVLQYMIEKKSTHNFASQLSDLLNPVNLNAVLIDFLKDDDSKIVIAVQESSGHIERVKWYRADEESLREQLKLHAQLDDHVKAMEKAFETNKTVLSSENLKYFTDELKSSKIKLAGLNKQLVPELLRRLAIANVSSHLVGYVVQFADDLFELMQYPRILRHIVFNVLEKSVHSLAEPLEDKGKELLQKTVKGVADQSVFDFFFSNRLKANLGSKIVALFSSMEATENQRSYLVGLGQTVAKWILPGQAVFSLIQGKIEKLIKIKSKEAVNWSAAKVVVTLNKRIMQSAKDQTHEGMKAVIASQLRKIIGLKEEEKKALESTKEGETALLQNTNTTKTDSDDEFVEVSSSSS